MHNKGSVVGLRSHTLVGEAGEVEIKKQRRERGEERNCREGQVHLYLMDSLVDPLANRAGCLEEELAMSTKSKDSASSYDCDSLKKAMTTSSVHLLSSPRFIFRPTQTGTIQGRGFWETQFQHSHGNTVQATKGNLFFVYYHKARYLRVSKDSSTPQRKDDTEMIKKQQHIGLPGLTLS